MLSFDAVIRISVEYEKEFELHSGRFIAQWLSRYPCCLTPLKVKGLTPAVVLYLSLQFAISGLLVAHAIWSVLPRIGSLTRICRWKREMLCFLRPSHVNPNAQVI